MTTYSCRINDCDFETDHPLGIVAHATKHKNEFTAAIGREPNDYAEVLALFNDAESPDGVDDVACPACGQVMYDQSIRTVPLAHWENCHGDGGSDQ